MAANMRSVCGPLWARAIGLPLMLVAASAAFGAPGDLDFTFGNGGRVFINMDANAESAASLVPQNDGKLLLGRSTNFMEATNVDLSVVRLNQDGQPDAGFGAGGMASTNLPGITASTKVVVQQGSGRVVVAGQAWNDGKESPGFIAIARYRADGTLDATFGSAGFVLDDFGAAKASVGALLMQPDGRFVAAGTAELPGGADMAFARFNENGLIDTTFGVSGHLIVDVEGAGRADSADAIVRRSDGRLIAAGVAHNGLVGPHPVLLALTADGAVDTSFGTAGRATPDIGGEQIVGRPHLGLQSDGRIVVAGVVRKNVDSSCVLLVTRLNESGSLDQAFGKSGFVKIPLSNCDMPVEVIVASDDHILIGSASSQYGYWDYGPSCPCTPFVTRLAPNGELDSSFGVGGTAGIDTGLDGRVSGVDVSFIDPSFPNTRLLQQTDGNVVVAATGDYDAEQSIFNGASWFHPGIVVARLLKSGASPGLVGFKATDVVFPESQPNVVLYVQRSGGAAGFASVEFATSDDTALSGSDYARTSGTLTWADGDRADKAITIAITDDAQREGLEQLRVTLSNPTGGTFLATSRSTVLIQDNDSTPVTASPPIPGALPSPGPAPGGATGGGALGWAQLFTLALGLAASRRRGSPVCPRL